MHISNILEDNELQADSVIKYYLTTAADGKEYKVAFYALDMMLAIGFRPHPPRTDMPKAKTDESRAADVDSYTYNARTFGCLGENLQPRFYSLTARDL